jgi:hypothetical protein
MNMLYNKIALFAKNDDKNQISSPVNEQIIQDKINKFDNNIEKNQNKIDNIRQRIQALNNSIATMNNVSQYEEQYNELKNQLNEIILESEKLSTDIANNKIIPSALGKLRLNNDDDIRFRNDPKSYFTTEMQNQRRMLDKLENELNLVDLKVKNILAPEIKNDITYNTKQESASLFKRTLGVGKRSSFLKNTHDLLNDVINKLAKKEKVGSAVYSKAHLKKTSNILDKFEKGEQISGKELNDAINELKNSSHYNTKTKGIFSNRQVLSPEAKLMRKLVTQLEVLPTKAITQEAKVQKSKTNIFNRIFKRNDYKAAKGAKNEIKGELSGIASSKINLNEDIKDIERKIKNIDKEIFQLKNPRNSANNVRGIAVLNQQKKELTDQINQLKEKHQKTVDYKSNTILQSKNDKKTELEVGKLEKKIQKLNSEKTKHMNEIEKLKNRKIKINNNTKADKTTNTKKEDGKIKDLNLKISKLNEEINKLREEKNTKSANIRTPGQDSRKTVKEQIIDKNTPKMSDNLSTNRGTRSFSVSSIEDINTKNFDNKLGSFNKLMNTDINPSAGKSKSAEILKESRNDPKIFEKKMNEAIDKEVKERIKFESDRENEKYLRGKKILKGMSSSSFSTNNMHTKDLKDLESEHKNNLKNIKDTYKKYERHAKDEVKELAKEMKNVNKAMNR